MLGDVATLWGDHTLTSASVMEVTMPHAVAPATARRSTTSATDEAELWRRRRAGCDRAAEELVRRYLPLAIRLAGDHVRRTSDRHDDARASAYLGLVKAVARYEPERGNSFAVYAKAVVRGEILRHLRGSRYAIHVPRPLHERWMQVRAAQRAAVVELGHEPSSRELASWLDWDEATVVEALAVITAEQPGPIAGVSRRDPQAVADEAVRHVSVNRAVATLDERLRHVVVRRFRDEATQAQIADELHMSQAHVSRLLARALDLLREALGDDGGALLAS